MRSKSFRKYSKTTFTVFLLSSVPIIILLLIKFAETRSESVDDYWIWRNSDLQKVTPDDHLIIYQGDYLLNSTQTPFIKRGPTPQKLNNWDEITLLVRVYHLREPKRLANYLSILISQWHSHKMTVSEIQLDHDSPSSQLKIYSDFIQQLKFSLKTNRNVDISITGLVTWLTDSPEQIQHLAKQVVYIDYQLYNNFKPLDNIESYYPSINAIQYPYKIGVTTADEFSQLSYPKNKHYLGKSIFLNLKEEQH